jgi:hypothetical protein
VVRMYILINILRVYIKHCHTMGQRMTVAVCIAY